jgi:hypothetical protein
VKFNQIEILDNLTLFCDESLVSGEINFSGCIVRNYENCGLRDFLKRSVVLSSERKIKKILKARRLEKKRDKLKFIQNMMSGFGWGIPLCRLYKNKIIFDIILGANAKSNSFLFFALQLNGFLNAVFGRKINLERTEEVKDCLVSRAIYSF